MNLIFATHNKNKILEIDKLKSKFLSVCSLYDLNYSTPIAEMGTTLEENAIQKATAIFRHFGQSCFADDTALEVAFLNGDPGVYSSRYSGEKKPNCRDSKNIEKLLFELKNTNKRKAQFRTVIALCWYGDIHLFEGIVQGQITKKPRGIEGFGYDPIFVPDGDNRTFAEMGMIEKAKFSHRTRAFLQLINFLEPLEQLSWQ